MTAGTKELSLLSLLLGKSDRSEIAGTEEFSRSESVRLEPSAWLPLVPKAGTEFRLSVLSFRQLLPGTEFRVTEGSESLSSAQMVAVDLIVST